MRAASIAVLSLTLLGAFARVAHADKDTCINAYEQTQTLRKDGKLVQARNQATICAKDACPTLLAKDCAKWHNELDQQIPTVLLDVKNASGLDVTDVKVKVDGVLVTERIDGKPLPLDPGPHVLRFEPEGGAAVDKSITLKDGERGRKIAVTVTPLTSPATSTAQAEKASPTPARPIPSGVWIFGGASVVALATSAVFAIDGLGRKSDLDGCRPGCRADDVDAMSTRFTFADVALGVGVAAGAAALYLFLTRPVESPSSRAASSPPTARLSPRSDAPQPSIWLMPTGIIGRF